MRRTLVALFVDTAIVPHDEPARLDEYDAAVHDALPDYWLRARDHGKVTKAQIKEIAEYKLKDMNAYSVEGAMRSIAGTARSMGLEVVD